MLRADYPPGFAWPAVLIRVVVKDFTLHSEAKV